MTDYKALTYIVLKEVRRNPGDLIPESDFFNQAEIDTLVQGGAISADLDSPLHPDHVDTHVDAVETGLAEDA